MRIYVGNLSYRSNAEDVRKAFAPFGEVAKVELAVDRATGRSAGYAWVEMPNQEQAQEAINRLNRKEINSRVVSVHAAADAQVTEKLDQMRASQSGRASPPPRPKPPQRR